MNRKGRKKCSLLEYGSLLIFFVGCTIATLSRAQSLAYASEVANILKSVQDAFANTSVDIEQVITDILTRVMMAEHAIGEQKKKQAESLAATEDVKQKGEDAYNAGTNAVSIVEGALGKKHEIVRKLRQLADSYNNTALRGKKVRANDVKD